MYIGGSGVCIARRTGIYFEENESLCRLVNIHRSYLIHTREYFFFFSVFLFFLQVLFASE